MSNFNNGQGCNGNPHGDLRMCVDCKANGDCRTQDHWSVTDYTKEGSKMNRRIGWIWMPTCIESEWSSVQLEEWKTSWDKVFHDLDLLDQAMDGLDIIGG